MAVIVKDGNGKTTTLASSAVALGVGANDISSGNFEVVGSLISRTSADAGGAAFLLSAEGPGLCSIWTNNSYDPAKQGSGWRRTINLLNGNVGIGGSKDAVVQAPAERLVVAGNILATGDVRLSGADCAEDFEVDETEPIEPGAVMVIADEAILRQCEQGYDTRVAGVLSRAGGCRPGILLGQRPSFPA